MEDDDPRNKKNLRDDDDLARPVQLEPMDLPKGTADHMVSGYLQGLNAATGPICLCMQM